MDRSLRLTLLAWYAAAVGSITLVPWLAVSMTDAGLDASTVAAVMLLVPLGHLVAGPGWTWFADRVGAPRAVLRGSTAVTAISGLVLVGSAHPTLMLIAVVCWAATRAPMFPLADALTIQLLGADRRDYGRIRAVGSMMYLLAMLGGGFLREVWPRGPLWVGVGLLVATALISWRLPAAPPPPHRPASGSLRRAALHPDLAPLIVICVLHGITVTTYDGMFALHVERLGHRPALTGMAVAFGVFVEVVVMMQGRRLIDRFGPMPLFAIAVASGIPRWILTATAPSPWILAAAQGLHGVGFGLYWVAGVALFSERAPREVATSVQSLLSASSFGAGFLLSMSLASALLQRYDTTTLFVVATAISALATAGAVRLWLSGRPSAAPSRPS